MVVIVVMVVTVVTVVTMTAFAGVVVLLAAAAAAALLLGELFNMTHRKTAACPWLRVFQKGGQKAPVAGSSWKRQGMIGPRC